MATRDRPLRCTSVRGVLQRTGADGVVRYFARYVDSDGKRKLRLLSVGSIMEAKAKFTQLKAGVLNRREVARAHRAAGLVDPALAVAAQVERAKLTVEQLAEKFCALYTRPKLHDVDRYRADAKSTLSKRVLPHWKGRSAVSITGADLDALAALLAEKYEPASIKHVYAVVSRMYVWGRKQGIVDCDSPTRQSEAPRVNNTRDEFFSIEEVETLLEQTRDELHVLIAIGVYAGLRKSEIFALRWSDLSLERSLLRVVTSKSGKPRDVPINAELSAVLRGWKDRCPLTPEGLVVPVEGRQGTKYEMLGLPEAVLTATKRQPEMPTHLLRHTFASHFMMAGGNILTLQKLLGHASLTMTMRYAHLAPDFMRAEVARMSFRRPVAELHNLDAARRSASATE